MRRLLAVDVGNTNCKYGLFESGRLCKTWSHPTAGTNGMAGPVLEQTDAPVFISSVVPNATTVIRQWCKEHDREFSTVSCENQDVIADAPSELGTDLLAASAGALKLYGKKGRGLIVLGLGTATTLTALTAGGEFAGVQLTLGLTDTLRTLAERCALLPDVTEDLTSVSLGFDTKSAMCNGTLLAHIGLVEAWIKNARAELSEPAVVVATGGWASTLSQHTDVLEVVDPDLVLKGIYLLAL